MYIRWFNLIFLIDRILISRVELVLVLREAWISCRRVLILAEAWGWMWALLALVIVSVMVDFVVQDLGWDYSRLHHSNEESHLCHWRLVRVGISSGSGGDMMGSCRREIARLSLLWHLAVDMPICFCMDCCQHICIILHVFISDILVLFHIFDSWSVSTVRNDLLGRDHYDIWKRNSMNKVIRLLPPNFLCSFCSSFCNVLVHVKPALCCHWNPTPCIKQHLWIWEKVNKREAMTPSVLITDIRVDNLFIFRCFREYMTPIM